MHNTEITYTKIAKKYEQNGSKHALFTHSWPSAETKNAWSYTSTPPQYVFMAWCLVKHGDNFTLI
jgi:hypothetical protein